MYTIGEFSVMSGLTKKTLRYYDEINLLQPADINSKNGYRLYEKQQLTKARQIVYYKNLGITLKRIQSLLDGENRDWIIKDQLKAIDDQIDILKAQKKALFEEMNQQIQVEKSKIFNIQKSTFTGGPFIQLSGEEKDVHQLISDFYAYVSNQAIALTSQHFIRKNQNPMDEQVYIFAYTSNRDDLTRCDKQVFLISNVHLEERPQAYEALVDHSKNQGSDIIEYIEFYEMKCGEMLVTIYGVIDE